jgi:hypothetical protein
MRHHCAFRTCLECGKARQEGHNRFHRRDPRQIGGSGAGVEDVAPATARMIDPDHSRDEQARPLWRGGPKSGKPVAVRDRQQIRQMRGLNDLDDRRTGIEHDKAAIAPSHRLRGGHQMAKAH